MHLCPYVFYRAFGFSSFIYLKKLDWFEIFLFLWLFSALKIVLSEGLKERFPLGQKAFHAHAEDVNIISSEVFYVTVSMRYEHEHITLSKHITTTKVKMIN